MGGMWPFFLCMFAFGFGAHLVFVYAPEQVQWLFITAAAVVGFFVPMIVSMVKSAIEAYQEGREKQRDELARKRAAARNAPKTT